MSERSAVPVAEGDDFDFEIVNHPEPPMRPGEEENFGAALRFEDLRRREVLVAEAHKLLKQLEGTAQGEAKMTYSRSKSARERQRKRRQKMEELAQMTVRRNGRWEGPIAPATVVNLNPVPLKLSGQLQNWTIPAAGKGNALNLKYRGRVFKGSYMTIRTPEIWDKIIDTNDVDATARIEVLYIPPLGIAHQFYSHYTSGASDAQGMGGVLVFEGLVDELKPKSGKDRGAPELWVPREHITLGGLGEVVYRCEAMTLEDCIGPALQTQRLFAEQQIAEGHSYATSKIEGVQGNLTYVHKLWHNFALDMGYLEEPEEWASERLKDTPNRLAVFCPHCRTKQGDEEQYFCPECNAPFNALKAYLAGKPVALEYLETYEGAELDLILAEAKKRAGRRAMLEGLVQGPEKPAKPSGAKAAKEQE